MMLHNKKVDGLLGTKEGEKEGIELEMEYVKTNVRERGPERKYKEVEGRGSGKERMHIP